MSLEIFGEHPLATDSEGKLKSRIGTLFVSANALVTLPRMTHAMQRLFYRDHLNALRRQQGLEDLTEDDVYAIWDAAIDLIMEDRDILIRPESNRMPLAFQADERLQELASKRHIRFSIQILIIVVNVPVNGWVGDHVNLCIVQRSNTSENHGRSFGMYSVTCIDITYVFQENPHRNSFVRVVSRQIYTNN